MGPLIAIDVAILPPGPIAELAIGLSRRLPRTEFLGLELDETHLPHVTLTQQYVSTDDLPAVAVAIEDIAMAQPQLAMRIEGPGRGTNSVWMKVERTPALEKLHRRLMDALQPFERTGADRHAFADGDARPTDLEWVGGFRGTSSYERYTPHITLGHASRVPRVEPVTFDAEVIGLCQLGRFCTCRTVLRQWTLSSSGLDRPGIRRRSE